MITAPDTHYKVIRGVPLTQDAINGMKAAIHFVVEVAEFPHRSVTEQRPLTTAEEVWNAYINDGAIEFWNGERWVRLTWEDIAIIKR